MEEVSNVKQLLESLNLEEEIKHQLADSIEKISEKIKRLEFVNQRIINDKEITTNFLNTTVQELESANSELKGYQEQIIAEKKKALAFKDIQLEQIVNAMPYSLAFIDLNYSYQIYNKTYQDWFGFENIIGKTIKELWAERHQSIFPMVEKTIKENKEQIVYNHFKDKNGNDLIIRHLYIPAIDNDQNVIGAYVFGEDITEIKEKEKVIEDQNVSLKKYIDSNMQLENFAYLASHDLRSPLFNVINFTNLLESSAASKLSEHEKKFLGFIKGSTQRMEAFIRDLLSFSLIENHIISTSPINLKSLIDEIIFDLNLNIKESRAKIQLLNLDVVIEGDKLLIKSLFQNLISNALKFVKPDQAPNIEIALQSHSKFHLISVQDQGIGISKEYMDQIFVIFKRLNRQQDYSGTGIGLSICKSVITKLGGEIWCENNDLGGTTFFVKLLKWPNNK